MTRPSALVTGAGKRIGRALALLLADEGFAIGVHYNSSRTAADEVVALIKAKGGNAVALQADLSRETQIAALVGMANDALGALSVLVNSASIFEDDSIDDVTRDSWDKHIETNLRAPLKLAQDFAAQAETGDSAANNLIVNLIDQRVLKLTPQFLSYTVSKTALYSLTKTLAQALGPRGIRVNAIGPGPTLKNARQTDEDWRRQNEATVLGRGATPEDICGAMQYLLRARAVTGQMIAVDGGQHLAWATADVLVKE